MKKRVIYNLEFPSHCTEMELFGYRFCRTENYEEQLQRLQHKGNFYSEFHIKANTGEHAVTSYVILPENEQKASFEWYGSGNTALMDLLLLLSLFTQREVFAGESEPYGNDVVLFRDPRLYAWGGILRTSIPYKEKQLDDDSSYDVGFEEGINNIYQLIRTPKWQNLYSGGYFLFLARQAFHFQPLEASFTQCWTIWEHLFAVHNKNWLSTDTIRNLGSHEKISFILTEYAMCNEITTNSRNRIQDLVKTRNRLIHFGRFPESGNFNNDAVFFILTLEMRK